MDLPERHADAPDGAPDPGLPAAVPPAPVVPAASPPASAVIRPASGRNPPLQSREDTDAGWGERPEPDDDERLYRDRPPHWEK
jgi:hypothetical protein